MRTLALAAAALLLLLAALSFTLPSRWKVERTLHVEAPPDTLRPLVVDVRRWPEWLPWSEQDDPSLKRAFEGSGGPGTKMTWSGERIGDGVLTVVTAGDGAVAYTSSVGGGRATFEGWVRLEPDGTGARVTWGESGEFGNPLLRWFGTSFEEANGGDYERGLLNLQRLATGQVKRPFPGTPGTDPAAMVPLAPSPDAGPP